MTVDDTAPRARGGLLRWLPLLLILAGLATAFAMGWHKYLSFETLKAQRAALAAFVAAQPLIAVGAFVAVYFVFTLLMIPGALWLTIGAGFLFGLAGGSALTVLGATLGATALFLVARTALGAPLRRRAGPFLKRLEAGFAENPFSYMLTLRFLPVVPFPVANIAPALLGAKLRDFVVATALGIVPGTVAYAWIGSGLGAAFDNGQEPNIAGFARQLFPAFLALAAVSLAPALIKRFRTRKAA
jgi:uncharacterized membrane protein YdjX (TVP38/TMEM64 family)